MTAKSESKSFMAKENEVKKNWYLVDAAGQVVGRLASEIAVRLRGKHKAIYTPHNDTGDFIVVVNADKIRFTGRKPEQKLYTRYSGFIGGLKQTTAKTLMASKPREVIMHAVRGMLPKNSLGRRQLKKLKVYAGGEHPHAAQKPEPLVLTPKN
ncbi:MAG: 50S ribosomal protein L13 [Deltaproteobacteria bacterium]|jgi:large subunit ribosomal protein L13|nr:50S ribosomal protein L13 [Deltaproteobacteria bacterium]